MNIDTELVQRIDWELAEKNIPLRARPFEVVFRLRAMSVESHRQVFGFPQQDEMYNQVMAIYKKLYPNDDDTLNILSGGVVIQDRVYCVNVPVIFGHISINPIELIDIPEKTLEFIFRDHVIYGWRAFYGVCDLIDIGYGVDDLIKSESHAINLLAQIKSNISAMSRILMKSDDVDSMVQNACITAELSIKSALKHLGYTDQQLRKLGHCLGELSALLVKLRSENSDNLFLSECNNFPNYVNTRYKPSGLSRMELMSLMMRAQFVSAEAIRRIANRHMAWDVDDGSIPSRYYLSTDL